MRAHLSFLAVLAFTVTFHSIPSFAQWQLDGAPISIASGNQSYPVITFDEAYGAIVTWSDMRNGNADIYAQRIDASGVVQWTVNGVALCTVGGGQYAPIIIADGAGGGAIVVWSDDRGGVDVYAQRIDATGATQWTPGGVAVCIAVEDQLAPMITSDGAQGVIVAWYDWRNGVDYDIYAQRIDASGVAQWTPDGVALCTAAADQYGPTIAGNGAGGAIVVWYDYRAGDSDLYAQRINAVGVAQWTPGGVSVCASAAGQYSPMIVSDGGVGATLVWTDWRSGSSDIYAQRLNGSGAVQWISDGVALCTAAGEQFYPAIVADESGGASVTWWDRRGPTADIYAQRVNGSGTVLWTSNGVVLSAAAGDQIYPKIASDGVGGAIVTWFDYRTGTGDIYAQRVLSSGAVHWATDGLALCTAIDHQNYPTIMSIGAGNAIVTWQDWRNGPTSDIYAQQIDLPTSVGDTPPTAALTVLPNHPNPFTGVTELRIRLSSDSDVSLEVYDVAGRRVRMQSLGPQRAGWNAIPFDGRDDAGRLLASGVYFYRVTANRTTVTNKMVIAR